MQAQVCEPADLIIQKIGLSAYWTLVLRTEYRFFENPFGISQHQPSTESRVLHAEVSLQVGDECEYANLYFKGRGASGPWAGRGAGVDFE